MKRILLIALVLMFGVSVFAGCGNEPENYASISSYMLGSPERNDPNDSEIEERLLTSKALFAYQLSTTE